MLGGWTSLYVTARRDESLGPDVYVGYLAHLISPHNYVYDGGEYAAYAVWITRGVE